MKGKLIMNNSPIFEKEKYNMITEFVEQKIPLLKENKDFSKKYSRFYKIIDELEPKLNEGEKELFNELIDLNDEVEKYYFLLAYSLGVKYGEELNKI